MEQSSLREKLMQRAKAGGALPAQASSAAAAPATQTTPAAQQAPATQTPPGAQQAPVGKPASVLDKMKAQATASAAKGATVTNIHASAPAGATNAASQPTVAPPATNLLQKLKERAATTPSDGAPAAAATQASQPASQPVDRVEAAGLAALEQAAALNEVEQEPQDPVSFQASDVNPPEQPDTPVDDPDVLAQQTPAAVKSKKTATETPGESAAEDEKKKRGRPSGSVTVKPLTDDGYIFGRAYEAALMVFQDEAKAQVCAQNALKSFREVRA